MDLTKDLISFLEPKLNQAELEHVKQLIVNYNLHNYSVGFGKNSVLNRCPFFSINEIVDILDKLDISYGWDQLNESLDYIIDEHYPPEDMVTAFNKLLKLSYGCEFVDEVFSNIEDYSDLAREFKDNIAEDYLFKWFYEGSELHEQVELLVDKYIKSQAKFNNYGSSEIIALTKDSPLKDTNKDSYDSLVNQTVEFLHRYFGLSSIELTKAFMD